MTEETAASVPTAKGAHSIFRSLMLTTLMERSCILAVLSSLGSHRPDASSCTVPSRFRCRPCGREYIVRGLFDGSLPPRLTP